MLFNPFFLQSSNKRTDFGSGKMDILDEIGSKSENDAGFSTSCPWHTICYIYYHNAFSKEQAVCLK
jgi:hypothetical protein